MRWSRAQREDPHPHELEFQFDYSTGTAGSSPHTLGSLQIQMMEKDQFTEAALKDEEAAASKLNVEEQEASFTAEDWYRNGFRASNSRLGQSYEVRSRESLTLLQQCHPPQSQLCGCLFLPGGLRAAAGDTDGAIHDINQAMQSGFQYPHNCYYSRGLYREKKGDLDGALGDYEEAIRPVPPGPSRSPSFTMEIASMPGAARERKGSLVGAAEDYSELIRMHPDWTDTVEIYEFRARVREAMGDRSGAVQTAKMANGFTPTL